MKYLIIYLTLAAIWALIVGWAYNKAEEHEHSIHYVILTAYFLFPISLLLTIWLFIKDLVMKKHYTWPPVKEENYALPAPNFQYVENGFVLHNWMDSDWFKKWEELAKNRVD